MLVGELAVTPDTVNKGNFSRELSLIDSLRIKWDLKPLWMAIFSSFMVAFVVFNIWIVKNNEDCRFIVLVVFLPLLLVGFFPVAFHLLVPGLTNKVVGLILVLIFIFLFALGLCFDLKFPDTKDRKLKGAMFFIILDFICVPLVLYSLYLIFSIIFRTCRISGIEAAITDGKRLKVNKKR